MKGLLDNKMDEELSVDKGKLLLVKKGTSVYDLQFAMSILNYYGFSVKEFESGYNNSSTVYK